MRRCFIVGLSIWLAATIALRFIGQYVLRPDNLGATALLFLASVPLMALIARRICAGARVARDQWPAAGIALVMPTLLLDTISSTFFPLVYPNIPADAAGLFGGWMLCCCAGALLGVSFARR